MKKVVARRRFGQHFLTDPAILDRIIRAFSPQRTDKVLEIGPGTGVLTEVLLQQLDHLTAVELDRDLAALLDKKYDSKRLTVIQKDILRFDLATLAAENSAVEPGAGTIRIVGNLPYNISTPLIFHLLDSMPLIADMVFMVQKEVALRLCARAGDRNFGRLSVMSSLELDCEYLFDVPPDSFTPPPRVDSAVIRLLPVATRIKVEDPHRFEQIVKQAFSQRRKTLRNSLSRLVTAEQFVMADIDPKLRAEKIDTAGFARLANIPPGVVPV